MGGGKGLGGGGEGKIGDGGGEEISATLLRTEWAMGGRACVFTAAVSDCPGWKLQPV